MRGAARDGARASRGARAPRPLTGRRPKPGLNAILSFYRSHAGASAAGTPGLAGSAEPGGASRELQRVAFSFLMRDEGRDWATQEKPVRDTRLRMGRQRVRL